MNLPMSQMYRLTPRGRGGLACDKAGVALGAADLVRVSAEAEGRRRCEVRSRSGLGRVLSAAYGPQPEQMIVRVHRGLNRAALAFEAGDFCLAGIETVLLGLPDPTPSALAKLAEVAELEKWGAGWESQPRVPAGQTDGGQWTTEDGVGGEAALDAKPATRVSPHPSVSSQKPILPLDDGVFRPGIDTPHVILTAGGEEDESESRQSNESRDFKTLEDVFPGLKHAVLHAVLAPIDGFLGASEVADEANLEATMGQYRALIKEIKGVDPSFVDEELLPADGIADLSGEARANLINNLRMRLAAAYYRMRGDVGPLQVETLRFLQDSVGAAYQDAVSLYDAGNLQPYLSRNEAIGNYIDREVRSNVKRMFAYNDIPYGPRSDVTINNRDYQSSGDYRIPDVRLRDVSFDWTLTEKTINTPQISDYFRTESQVRAVIVIRPSQLGRDATYLIPRDTNAPWWR
jgi:hypothetical protein